MEELKEKIVDAIRKGRCIAKIDCGRDVNFVTYVASEEQFRDKLIILFQAYLKEHNYVQLDEDQSLPEPNITADAEPRCNPMCHRAEQDNMRKANFKKVKSENNTSSKDNRS